MKNVTYINAGAGSGKTYTLTEKLAEILSNRKSNVEPSQVILTTFTELAATEFREKAREQILAKDNLEAAAKIDSAVIGTVHSMALHFIKKFWYLLDYGADIQTISERDDDFYMSQSLARIVQKTANEKHLENFRKFRDYFDIMDGNRPDYLFWQPILRAVVEKMEYYGVDDVTESIQESTSTIKKIYNADFLNQELKDNLVNTLKVYRDYCQDVVDGKYNIDKRTLPTFSKHIACSDFLIAQLSVSSTDLWDLYKNFSDQIDPLTKQAGGKKAKDICPDGYYFISDIISIVIPTSASHQDILIAFVNSIFELAAEWRKDFKQYKKDNHIISYNDMEQLFLQLITEKKEVKTYIKERYRLIMVDEFQDSNPIQLKIFNQLSELIAEKGGRSYWVGDPKQSIYGFRGADTELVNEVASQFTFHDDDKWHTETDGSGTRRLVYSWRSRAKLVELVNDTFLTPFQKDHIDDKLITLKPKFVEKNSEKEERLINWGGIKNDKVAYEPIVHWECKENTKEVAVQGLADYVKALLNSGIMVHHGQLDKAPSEIHPYDVSILCRTNADAKDIVKSLRKIGVPVSEPEDAIMQRIEIQLVVTLLQYIQSPSNKHVRADLMRLLGNKNTADILKDRLKYLNDLSKVNEKIKDKAAKKKDTWLDDETLFKELDSLALRLKHLSIPEMVDGLIYDYDIPAISDKWLEGDIRRQNLSTLRELATDYDQRCLQLGLGASISGFIYFLNSTEPDKSPDNHSDTVKVLTYHGSKGLQWPMVILYSLNNNALDDNDCIKKSFMKVFEVETDNGNTDIFKKQYYLHFFPSAFRGSSIPDKMIEKIIALPLYTQMKTKVEREERRLMYVGMTRAKDRLYTFGFGKNNKGGELSAVQKTEFDWLKNVGVDNPRPEDVWGNPKYLPLCEAPSSTTSDPDVPSGIYKWEKIKKSPTHTSFEKRFLSPSKLEDFNESEKFSSYEEWKVDSPAIDSSKWSKDYATVGDCIHDFFAVFRPGETETNRALAQSIIDGYGMTNYLTDSIDDIIAAAEWLYQELNRRFPQKETDYVETEVPFQISLADGQTLRGEMDLLWYYEGGKKCVLVDYKSFRGTDFKPTQKYYPQLSAYAHALHEAGINVTAALLFYPVSGVVHELK